MRVVPAAAAFKGLDDSQADGVEEEGGETLATGRTCGHMSTYDKNLAERPGFEPGEQVYPTQRFSKPSLSAAQPPLRTCLHSTGRRGSVKDITATPAQGK